MTDTKLPMRCANFDACSANRCPLESYISEKDSVFDDPMATCPMARATRYRYWTEMPKEEQAQLPWRRLL